MSLPPSTLRSSSPCASWAAPLSGVCAGSATGFPRTAPTCLRAVGVTALPCPDQRPCCSWYTRQVADAAEFVRHGQLIVDMVMVWKTGGTTSFQGILPMYLHELNAGAASFVEVLACRNSSLRKWRQCFFPHSVRHSPFLPRDRQMITLLSRATLLSVGSGASAVCWCWHHTWHRFCVTTPSDGIPPPQFEEDLGSASVSWFDVGHVYGDSTLPIPLRRC